MYAELIEKGATNKPASEDSFLPHGQLRNQARKMKVATIPRPPMLVTKCDFAKTDINPT